MNMKAIVSFIKIYLPIILSLIAIIVSWRSCHIASDAHKLNRADFSASRTLSLTAEVHNVRDVITFEPKDKMMELDSLYVYHPVEFSTKGVAFYRATSSLTLPLGSWTIPEEFKKIIMESAETMFLNTQNARENEVETLFTVGRMPLLIVSSHTSHAKRFHDASLYDLEFTYLINLEEDEQQTERQLEFTRVFFISRLSDSDYEKFIKQSDKGSYFRIPIAEQYRQFVRP